MKYIIYSIKTKKAVYIYGRNIMFDYLSNAVEFVKRCPESPYTIVARNFKLERNVPYYLRF